ncbi:tetratricopeptide repeat protein [Amorphus orientalis]|uniref:Flp pilus assembly protein TadD n=1 Tax=Amorphus orientalis TaxID=649198 RepID=A0AAE3VM47_9HYPH|nr:tetratricopeptide repeat protein [Amorphus orientalis]MDQ0314275.1 Flp pilus assembly protein TadD [Amorphus orientalis]
MLTTDERLKAATDHVERHRLDEAEALFRDVLTTEPQNTAAVSGLGGVLLRRGAVDEAFEVIGRATSLDPGNPVNYENLAVVYRLRDESDYALTCLEAAVTAAPDRVEARIGLAEMLISTGRLDDAVEHIETAYQVHPDRPEVLVALGGAHMMRGDLAKAIASYRKALEVKPDTAEAHANLSTIYAGSGRPKDALDHAERAHALEPLNPAFASLLAGALEATGHTERGIGLIERMLVLHPRLPDLHGRLASLRLAAGQTDDALAGIVKQLRDNRDDPVLLETMSQLLHRAGRREQALTAARECLRRAPQSLLARTVERHSLIGLGRSDEIWPALSSEEPLQGPARLRVRLDDTIGVLETVPLLRAIPLAQSRGHEITIAAPEWLAALAGRVRHGAPAPAPQDGTGSNPAAEPGSDEPEDLPLLALPARAGISEAEMIAAPQCLVAAESTAAMWAQAVSEMPAPRIGFAWSAFPPGLDLTAFRHVFDCLSATPVSLVWDQYRSQLATMPEAIDGGLHIQGLDGAVAAVSALDAVIGGDGLPVHIAGALGIPGVAIVPGGQFWYWRKAEGGDRAVWYPSIRLVEFSPGQKRAEVIAMARATLEDVIAEAAATGASPDRDPVRMEESKQ